MKTQAAVGLVLAWVGTVATAYWVGGAGQPGGPQMPWKTKAPGAGAVASSLGVSAGTKTGTPWVQKGDKDNAGATQGGSKAALDRLMATGSMKDMVERTKVFLDCLGQLDAEGLAAAAKWLDDQPGEGRGPGRFGDRMLETLLLNTWGKKDPEAALAWTEERGGFGNFAVLSAWAEIDPQKAAAWAVANPSENRGPGGFGGRGGPGGGENENWNMLGVVSGALKGDPGAAVNLVQSMSEGRIRNQALDMVIDELYRTNPQAAKDLAAKMTDETMKASAAERVANRMAQTDPTQAMTYATALPAGESRSRAIAEVVDEWAQNDPDAVGQWLNQQPKSTETDQARRTYSMEIRRTDPEAAVAWANTITDDAQREQAVMRVAFDWLRRDEAAAKAWIESQPNASEALKNMATQPRRPWMQGGGRRGGGQ